MSQRPIALTPHKRRAKSKAISQLKVDSSNPLIDPRLANPIRYGDQSPIRIIPKDMPHKTTAVRSRRKSTPTKLVQPTGTKQKDKSKHKQTNTVGRKVTSTKVAKKPTTLLTKAKKQAIAIHKMTSSTTNPTSLLPNSTRDGTNPVQPDISSIQFPTVELIAKSDPASIGDTQSSHNTSSQHHAKSSIDL